MYVAEMQPSVADDIVQDIANQQGALLLTADKDFGELVFRQQRLAIGAVLNRLAGLYPLLEIRLPHDKMTQGH